MPWKECSVMDERVRFVARLLDGEKMAALCREITNSRQRAAIFSPSSKRATKRTRSSITEHSFHGITPSPKGKECHPCVRYKLSPMFQTAQNPAFHWFTLHSSLRLLRRLVDQCGPIQSPNRCARPTLGGTQHPL